VSEVLSDQLVKERYNPYSRGAIVSRPTTIIAGVT
jgi:hypothetical protein